MEINIENIFRNLEPGAKEDENRKTHKAVVMMPNGNTKVINYEERKVTLEKVINKIYPPGILREINNLSPAVLKEIERLNK